MIPLASLDQIVRQQETIQRQAAELADLRRKVEAAIHAFAVIDATLKSHRLEDAAGMIGDYVGRALKVLTPEPSEPPQSADHDE